MVTFDQPARIQGRHRRPPGQPGPGPHQWLASPAGDHRRDPLGWPPPPDGPTRWHVAGSGESALLQPRPEEPARLAKPRRPGRRRRAVLAFILVIACFAGAFAGALAAADAAHASAGSVGGRMLDWAEVHAAGHPYQMGGTGPYVYDCSGTVYAAAKALGITLPRTSYDMARGSPHLEIIPLSEAVRGDILVYPGAGHVEFKTIYRHGSFGALKSGTPVWWHTWNGYWHPVFALRVH